MIGEQSQRNEHYVGAQIRMQAVRAWRRPRPLSRVITASTMNSEALHLTTIGSRIDPSPERGAALRRAA
jgi:hypothetical protein